MTPLAERAWMSPMTKSQRGMFGEILAGAQFINCTALIPLLKIRRDMDEDISPVDELLECQLPASHTWLEWGNAGVAISDDARGSGHDVAFVCMGAGVSGDGALQTISFGLKENRTIFTNPDGSEEDQDRRSVNGRKLLNTAWFCIEAMQTPGGLCHEVHHTLTRQQRRNAERSGIPVHKWIEIRLGRARKPGHTRPAGETGRTVAWHYRRGHRVNHPNPNYPKWRKGGWCGDPAAGIRSHTYVVEVPE